MKPVGKHAFVGNSGKFLSELIAKAGLKRDDVIIAIDGKTTSQGSALTGYVRQYSANDKVKLTVIRDSKKQDIDVTLAERKDS